MASALEQFAVQAGDKDGVVKYLVFIVILILMVSGAMCELVEALIGVGVL